LTYFLFVLMRCALIVARLYSLLCGPAFVSLHCDLGRFHMLPQLLYDQFFTGSKERQELIDAASVVPNLFLSNEPCLFFVWISNQIQP